jgi:hypothetical protein
MALCMLCCALPSSGINSVFWWADEVGIDRDEKKMRIKLVQWDFRAEVCFLPYRLLQKQSMSVHSSPWIYSWQLACWLKASADFILDSNFLAICSYKTGKKNKPCVSFGRLNMK